MKNRKVSKKPYNNLINKLFIRTIILFVIAITIIFLIRSIVQGRLGDFIMDIFKDVYNLDSNSAQMMYHYKIRQNYDLIIVGSIICLFAFFYKIFLSWFTKYFDEMINGINGIVTEDEIKLSPELHFIESTMNEIKDKLQKNEVEKQILEQRKNDLIVYLAHDIKTPLTSIIGYLNLLEENPNLSIEERANYINITLDKANRLEKLINEFFEITQYNSNSIPLNKEEIDLGYMIVQVVDEAYPILKEKEKEVEINIPSEIVISGDAEKIARVFNNIFKNAINYSKKNSLIEIMAYEEQNIIKIVFKSQGGIDEEKISNIFDKFCRLDHARQSATGGSGLGLTIAKDIINLHGGNIFAESKNEETFIIIEIPKIN
ncbi:sensor histidine kinase [Clostridium sp.]|uniref:sensor histidine kinase n=1 Tax=Clostridium sp. TaxID=1506 RepID=UPI003F36563A